MAAEHPLKTSVENVCPHCHHKNRAGVLMCANCDRRMVVRRHSITKIVNLSDDRTTGSFPDADDASADDSLLLRVANAPMSIKIDPQAQTVLGRANPQRKHQPDVDLSAFKAFERGVSSIHAMIDQQQGNFVLADLDSSNGTFINGERLAPRQVGILHNGDEIRLGNLFARIYFRQPNSATL